MYHWEADQEDFLVLSGEALLIIEGEERPLRQWDFVHWPVRTKNIIVGVGDQACAILAIGAREHQTDTGWGGYTVDTARAGFAVVRRRFAAAGASAQMPAQHSLGELDQPDSGEQAVDNGREPNRKDAEEDDARIVRGSQHLHRRDARVRHGDGGGDVKDGFHHLLGRKPRKADVDPERDCARTDADQHGDKSGVHSNASVSIPAHIGRAVRPLKSRPGTPPGRRLSEVATARAV
jgi:hypothetical protein